MIIDEFKSGSTLIRFDDRDIETEESSQELIDYVIGIILKKIQNTGK